MGFPSAVASLIDVLADERDVSQGELIRTAVITMLDSFDGVGDSRAPLADADMFGSEGIAPEDFDPLTDVVVYRSASSDLSEPAEVYIDPSTRERLTEFCDVARLSRARVIRVAVDRYLFDEITKTGSSPAISARHPQSDGPDSDEAR
ncbi:hypothetical protein [Nocardia sp. NPDC051570]|uniref:hypothetical protein n=1 Tax=Nocardia sp. NPDC051570 TaxID=3364324 RepID=UPI003795E30E